VALRAWIVAAAGIFMVWLSFHVVGFAIGAIWGLWQQLDAATAGTPIEPPLSWKTTLNNLFATFEVVWTYFPLVIFAAVAVYVLLESMRRRPEEVY